MQVWRSESGMKGSSIGKCDEGIPNPVTKARISAGSFGSPSGFLNMYMFRIYMFYV